MYEEKNQVHGNKYRKRQIMKFLKKIGYFLLFLAVILMLFRSVYRYFRGTMIKTVLPEKTVYHDTVPIEILLVKNEQIVEYSDDFGIETFYAEGARVPVGAEIIRSNKVFVSEEEKARLNRLESAMKYADHGALGQDRQLYHYNLIRLQDDLFSDETSTAAETMELMKNFNTSDFFSDVSDFSDFSSVPAEELKRQYEEEMKHFSSKKSTIFSTMAGILSYKFDGLEGRLNFDSVEGLTYTKAKEYKSAYFLRPAQKACKIIDNFKCYMAVMVEDFKEFETYHHGDRMMLRIPLIGTVYGIVRRMEAEGEKGIILLEVREGIHRFYDKRFFSGEVVRSSQETYRIPLETVFQKKGRDGVFIKYKSGIVRFREVHIIARDEKFAFIAIGDDRGLIRLPDSEESVLTVTLYDEIFLSPKDYREDEMLE